MAADLSPAYSTDATVGCKNKEIDLSFTSKFFLDRSRSFPAENRIAINKG